jgi:hypothetical protein
MGLFSFFGKKEGKAAKVRPLAELSPGDTVIFIEDSPLPGKWKVEKAHRFVDPGAQTLVFRQLEMLENNRRGFIEIHEPTADEPSARVVASFPLEPTEYKAVHALELDPDSPPSHLAWRGRDYVCVSARELRFFRNTGEHPRDMVHLEYLDESGEHSLSFEFWSSTGTPVTSEGIRLTQDAVERMTA